MNSINQYWYEAGKAATGVADLEFSGEEVVVNYIIQMLPGDFKAMLETQLKIMFPNKNKFTWKEVQRAYMHSIGSGNRNTSQIMNSVLAHPQPNQNQHSRETDNQYNTGGQS